MTKINQSEVLDVLYQIVLSVSMPFPKADLDVFLELLQYAAPVLIKTADNQQKLYFVEFVEKCMELKDKEEVDEKLLSDVVSSMSSMQYLGSFVCC